MTATITDATATLEQVETLHSLVLTLLTHEEFGLKSACLTDDDHLYVQRAVVLITRAQSGEDVTYDEWTQLKTDSFVSICSPVADAISRMCSAFRNPKQAGISGMRDAIEKVIQAQVQAKERRVTALIQDEIRKIVNAS